MAGNTVAGTVAITVEVTEAEAVALLGRHPKLLSSCSICLEVGADASPGTAGLVGL